MSDITISSVGDCFITQHLGRDHRFKELQNFFAGHDVNLANLEVVLHHFDVYPAPVSGGSWACARPDVLEDLKDLGINLLGCANNHSIDWNIGGVLSTLNSVGDYGFPHAGLGKNLAEASMPAYLNTPHGRVALISVTSTCPVWGMAGEQRPDVMGRPGANVLRYDVIHRVLPEQMEGLKKAADVTEVNADRMLNEKEGFSKPLEGGFYLGNLHFEVSRHSGTITRMNQEDAQRIVKAIDEARRQADIVIVSSHGHERKGMDKSRPADFMSEFAHLCIDHGAHMFVSHGPHIWRGVEIYQGLPIFYGIGNFIFENESMERQPAEFYHLYNLDSTNTVSDGLDCRSLHGTRGLAADSRVYESAAVSVTFHEGRLTRAELFPLTLHFKGSYSEKGIPALAENTEAEQILRHIGALCETYGTKMDIQQGKGMICLP